MKKPLCLFLICFCSFCSTAQTGIIKLDSIASYAYGAEKVGFKVSVDENENLQFVNIIDSLGLSKGDLYNKVISYFAYAYKDSKEVLQQQDKENGLIIAKGTFGMFSYTKSKLVSNLNQSTWFFSYKADHTVRVDIKDGRLRYILTISNYIEEINTVPYNSITNSSDPVPVIKCAPFVKDYTSVDVVKPYMKKGVKNLLDIKYEAETKAFMDLCVMAKASIIDFEKKIKLGNTKEESENW